MELNIHTRGAGHTVGLLVHRMMVFLLSSVLVWLLWNGSLVGAVSGIGEITWLQSLGLLILCNLLFKDSGLTDRK